MFLPNPIRLVFALCAEMFCSLLQPAQAATKTWNGSTTGSWLLATNWNPSGVPVKDVNPARQSESQLQQQEPT